MNPESTLFENCKIIGTDEKILSGWLLVSGGRIHSFGKKMPTAQIVAKSQRIVDLCGKMLLPGFIDIHTHGAVGVNLVAATAEELQSVSCFFASHGVSAFLVTTWSASRDEILATMKCVNEVMGKEKGAAILGLHMEGPFINPVRAGAQSPREIRAASPSEVLEYLDCGILRLITIAPEVEENQWLIAAGVDRGICISAGHSDANYEQVRLAVKQGLRHITHCFNAMRSFSHREPGVVGAALEIPALSCEIIVDKIHVHPAAVRLLMTVKPRDKVVLVTDSIPGTGMPDGVFDLQGKKVHYTSVDARLADGTLAGSVLTMDKALRNLMDVTGLPLEDVWMCASSNAAAVIGMEKQKGSIKPGMDADLVVLDENLRVVQTMVGGEIVYQSSEQG